MFSFLQTKNPTRSDLVGGQKKNAKTEIHQKVILAILNLFH
jgi:hypothetical protein